MSSKSKEIRIRFRIVIKRTSITLSLAVVATMDCHLKAHLFFIRIYTFGNKSQIATLKPGKTGSPVSVSDSWSSNTDRSGR